MLKAIASGLILSSVILGGSCGRGGRNNPNNTIDYSIPIDVTGNLVQIPISVNGAVPQPFILDTGLADTVISETYAAVAGARPSGRKVKVTGVGGTTVQMMDVVKNLLLDLEGVQWAVGGALVAPDPLNHQITQTTGQPFNGMIGASLFEAYVVEIDFLAAQMTLYPPRNYRYGGSGQVLPLKIRGRKPYIEAQIQQTPDTPTRSGTFLLDLGSSASLDVRGQISPPPQSPQRYLSGFGGEKLHPVGRIHRLILGSLDIPETVTTFESSTAAPQQKLSGRIGTQLLSRFKLIFNYSEKQVIFEPTETAFTPVDVDMSGLRLSLDLSEPGGVSVAHVYPDSPAQVAGILPGDRLVSVDGQSVNNLSLADIRQQLMGEPNAIRQIRLERDRQSISVSLQLRRLI